MKEKVRPRFTYANVIATLALFLALGGGAYAAVRLPKSSVGPKQLKKNAVTSVKVKKQAITAAKLKNGAVTAGKIGAQAVGATQIQDGAVTAAKVGSGSLTGAQINAATLGTVPSAQTANSILAPEAWHEVGAAQIGPSAEDGAGVGAAEIRTAKVGGAEVGGMQIGAAEVGTARPHLGEATQRQVRTGEVGPSQLGIARNQRGTAGGPQIGALEARERDRRAGELDPVRPQSAQVGIGHDRPGQVLAPQLRPATPGERHKLTAVHRRSGFDSAFAERREHGIEGVTRLDLDRPPGLRRDGARSEDEERSGEEKQDRAGAGPRRAFSSWQLRFPADPASPARAGSAQPRCRPRRTSPAPLLSR